MSTFIRKSGAVIATLLSVFMLVLMADTAMAQGKSDEDHGHGHGRNRNLGHNNASDGVMARVHTNHSVVYIGDPLEISVQFPRGADLIASGEVDAWLLIFSPGADTIPVPVSSVASEDNVKLFDIEAVDISTLPEGVYQLGLVMTVPDGDPLNIADWYNGLLGLVTVQGLTVSGMPLAEDVDGDGELECDLNDDGLIDGDDEVACEEGTDGGTDDGGVDDGTGDDMACDLNEDGVIEGDDEIACQEDAGSTDSTGTTDTTDGGDTSGGGDTTA